jgi:hypothetical protein
LGCCCGSLEECENSLKIPGSLPSQGKFICDHYYGMLNEDCSSACQSCHLWWKNIQEVSYLLGNLLIIGNYILPKLKLFKTKVCSEKIKIAFECMNNDRRMFTLSLKI